MSYESISIKEAVKRINADLNGWFLPPVQRPYVWGSRYENEKYICKLFDSILRGYPIGGLIIWNTEKKIPYKEFFDDYRIGDIPSHVDKGKWARKDKWLVYDGQQRLQTLVSCLKFTLNGKILIFNTLFDIYSDLEDPNETGFSFEEKNSNIRPPLLRMNELFIKQSDEKASFRIDFLAECINLTNDNKLLIEKNIDLLWDIFVREEIKSLAYFPVKHNDESRVNEIFERLNTGGVPLSQADLLFSKIKEKNYDFEENLQYFSKEIYTKTNNGYIFDSYSILQLINLIVNESIRIDAENNSETILSEFSNVWKRLEEPLLAFFNDFLWGQFKINNNSIIPKKLALLPMMFYFYKLYERNIKFRNLDAKHLLPLKQYLIFSQINDWNLQSIVDNFKKIIDDKSKNSSAMFEFPLEEFIKWLDERKKRNTILYVDNFVDYIWFSLKMLTPERTYQFEQNNWGRFNPEIDHLFPKKLKDAGQEYYQAVDILWNMQPVKGEINNFKKRRHPKEFFLAEGSKYLSEYDHLPSNDPNDDIWNNPLEFIEARKRLMIDYIKKNYKIDIKL